MNESPSGSGPYRQVGGGEPRDGRSLRVPRLGENPKATALNGRGVESLTRRRKTDKLCMTL